MAKTKLSPTQEKIKLKLAPVFESILREVTPDATIARIRRKILNLADVETDILNPSEQADLYLDLSVQFKKQAEYIKQSVSR